MAKFRTKPVVIEAVRWNGENIEEVNLFFNDGMGEEMVAGSKLVIETLGGDMDCRVGDWIIKGVKGEFYPCKPDTFGATYEPVFEKGGSNA